MDISTWIKYFGRKYSSYLIILVDANNIMRDNINEIILYEGGLTGLEEYGCYMIDTITEGEEKIVMTVYIPDEEEDSGE